jgi:hypothetical protein
MEIFGFDTKYAMHCARLGFQGVELVTTGRLQLPIEGEPADWLRAVRRGEVGFDEWWVRSLERDGELERLGGDDRYPIGPDQERIEGWMVHAHRAHWAARR